MSKNTETKDPSAQGSALNISKRSFIITFLKKGAKKPQKYLRLCVRV